MEKYIKTIACLVIALLLFSCSSFQKSELNTTKVASNENAEILFKQASSFMQSAKSEAVNYPEAYQFYKKALLNINHILSKYPKSKIAKDILTTDLKISGFNFFRFQYIETLLKPLAEAEEDPFSTTITLLKTRWRNSAPELFLLFSDYEEVGEREKVKKLLAKALSNQLATTTQGYILAKIAIGYGYIGEKQKASQILSLAENLSVVENEVRNDKYGYMFNIAIIAQAYAKIGNKQKAIQLLTKVNTIAKFLLRKNGKFAFAASGPDFLTIFINAYIEAGQFSKALHVSQAMQSSASAYEKEKLDIIMALAYAKYGKKNKSIQILKALLIAKNMQIDSNKNHPNLYKADTFVEIAKVFTELGDKDKAIQFIEKALLMIKPEPNKPFGNVTMSKAISSMPIFSQNAWTSTYLDKYRRSAVLANVAIVYSRLGKKQKAQQLLTQSLFVITKPNISKIEVTDEGMALIYITTAYAKANLQPNKEAKKILREIVLTHKPVTKFWKEVYNK